MNMVILYFPLINKIEVFDQISYELDQLILQYKGSPSYSFMMVPGTFDINDD
jgi:hypothetical protein